MKILNIGRLLICLCTWMILFTACKKFLQVPPPQTELVNTSVYNNPSTATAAVLGIYEKMMESAAVFSNGGITLYTGLSGDELGTPSSNTVYNEFYFNQVTPSNSGLKSDLWGAGYTYLFQANSVLEGLQGSSLSSELKMQLQGEAKFIRAFCHFYLVNLFGDIPLVTSSNYTVNASATRTHVDSVYQQIIRDLNDAEGLLGDNYVDQNNLVTTQRVRPNKWAAMALLARVYLFTKDWKDAENMASQLIAKSDFYSLTQDLDSVFLAGSPEAIWQLLPVVPNQNTGEGNMFVQDIGVPLYAFLDTGLLNSFESGDLRVTDWINSYQDGSDTYYYPFKYKINFSSDITEYYSVLRLAEQWLIRAEAKNEQQDINGAAADLNIVRARAGLPPTNAADYPSMQIAIQKERRHELFCEWGHRWMDLKRTGQIDAVLSFTKPSWQTRSALYPIPQTEIQNDPDLVQNPGY